VHLLLVPLHELWGKQKQGVNVMITIFGNFCEPFSA
jgi:hypothetical protein